MSETEQRSSYQWQMYRLNLISGGAIIAFALKSPREFEHALLVVPLFSFVLFLYWVHHAFVIRLQATEYQPPPLDRWEFLRRGSILLTILGNFVGLPLLSMFLYTKSDYRWLVWLDLVCIALAISLFVIWMYLQYSQRAAREFARRKAV